MARVPCVEMSRRLTLAHLKVSVHDVMLVNMIDTLQDLIDALAAKNRIINQSVAEKDHKGVR